MTKKGNFYITTAISYTNAVPHVGHAYEAIAADCVARFKKHDGYNVFFMTGTDDHGLKVFQSAQKLGVSPQKYVDDLAPFFKNEMCDKLNVQYDRFIRTTDADHMASVTKMWLKMEEAGDIYLDKYAGWYSVRDELFYTEDEITTLPDGKKISTVTKTELTWTEEESYFFKLSKYTDKLMKLYEDHPEFIQPDYRRNEIVSFVKQGLRDLSISRTSFDWGVPVPGNPKHVMYVWVDALANYTTGVGYGSDEARFGQFWPCDIHLVGKDIIRFHTVYWPAFLMSAGIALPKQVFAHGFLTNSGEKMSKSLGNVISPADLLTKYGSDAARYVLMREGTFGQDVDISLAGMAVRINADLANNLGNLAQRTLSQINKNCEGKVPEAGELQAIDSELLRKAQLEMIAGMREEIDKMQFSRVLEKIMAVARDANAYIDSQEPWKLKKTDTARMNTVLYVLAEVIKCLSIAIHPFTPLAAEKLLDQLNVAKELREFEFISKSLESGTALPLPQGVFPRIEEVAA